MSRIRGLLSQVADKLALNQPLLARAQRRYKADRRRAFTAHRKQLKAQRLADESRAAHHLLEAARQDKIALRRGHVAYKNHARAQFWLGRVKVLQQRINELGTSQAELEAQLKALDHVTIDGNKASGGTKRERLKAVALKSAAECAAGHRPNFYSQAGAWDVDHCITGEDYGERSDCSSWFTSVYKSCDLSDPNGERFTGGYTGTLVAHGRQIDSPEPGCAVIYGPGTGHHVEMCVGPGDRTIGHGSAPVDPGVIDLFGDGDYRFFSYV